MSVPEVASEPEQRKKSARVLGVAVSFLLGAALLTCVVVRLCGKAIFSRDAVVRTTTTLANLPAVAASGSQSVLLLGGSSVEMGLSPAVIDDELARLGKSATTFNYGFGWYTPALLRAFTERARATFEQAHAKAALSVVAFDAPIATTARLSDPNANNVETEVIMAMLGTRASFGRWLHAFPAQASRALVYRYGFGNAAPEGVLDAIKARWPVKSKDADLIVRPDASDDERALIDARSILRTQYKRVYPSGFEFWTMGTRGFTEFLLPETRDALKVTIHHWQTPQEMTRDLEQRRSCCDIENLVFDERFLQDYIAMLRELGAISEHTVLLVMPRNRFVYQLTPGGEQRLQAAIDRIAREAHVSVIDLGVVAKVEADDFIDTTHMEPQHGVSKLSTIFADRIAPLL